MVINFQKVLEDQSIYIVNRALRLTFALIFTYIFFEDKFFSLFFMLEGLLPIISLLSSILLRTRIFIFFIIILCGYFITTFSAYAYLCIWLIFEVLSSLIQFCLARQTNQKVELLAVSLLLIALGFAIIFELSLEGYILVMIAISLLRVMISIFLLKSFSIEIPNYYFCTLLRQLTALNFRYIIIFAAAASPLVIILYRVTNQIILLVWSYLKSTSDLPFVLTLPRFFSSWIFAGFVFFIVNLYFFAFSNLMISTSLNYAFIVFISGTIFLLFWEIFVAQKFKLNSSSEIGKSRNDI